MPLRRTGAEAAEAANAEGGFGKKDYFKLNEGEYGIYRILTPADAWPTCQVHMSIPTKKAPPNQKNWPERMSAVCQDDKGNFFDKEKGTWDEGYGDCYIHKSMKGLKDKFEKPLTKTSLRCWAVAVVRKESPPDENGVKITRDERKPDGTLKIVIMNGSWYGFFAQLNGIYQANGSINDRDMYIKLNPKGAGAFAEYSIIPRDKNPELLPGTPAWDAYEEAAAEAKLSYDDLVALVLHQSSPEYYGRFFDPSVTAEDDTATEDLAAGSGAQVPDPTDADLEAMQDRIQRRLAGAPAQAAAENASS